MERSLRQRPLHQQNAPVPGAVMICRRRDGILGSLSGPEPSRYAIGLRGLQKRICRITVTTNVRDGMDSGIRAVPDAGTANEWW